MDKPLEIVTEFSKLQRLGVVAEIMYSKGQIQIMQRSLFEAVQCANKINALTGGANDRQEEPHDETNKGRGEDPAKQPGNKAKSSRGLNRRLEERSKGK